jgi:hypothetical protein
MILDERDHLQRREDGFFPEFTRRRGSPDSRPDRAKHREVLASNRTVLPNEHENARWVTASE